MSEHNKLTTILEQNIDYAFAVHGYLDKIIEMWEDMMFTVGYEYNDIMDSYEQILSRSSAPFIQNALEQRIFKLKNS